MINKHQIYTALTDNSLLFEKDISLEKSEFVASQLEAFKQQGEEFLQTQTQPLPFSIFKLYWQTGERSTFQAAYFERRARLLVFSVLAKQTGEDKYIKALEDIMWAICSEFSWCLPAHFLKVGDAPLEFEKYPVQLDLFSSETGFALSEALALCRSFLSEDIIKMVILQVETRIFKPFESNELYRFELGLNNWAAVCGGAIGGAAMYLIKDKERLTSILHRSLSCMDVYLSSFGADGVCAEGVDYWTYGFGFFMCFADLLLQKTNSAIDLFAMPKVEAIARAGEKFYLGGAATISFSDGGEHGVYRVGLFSYLAKKYEGLLLPPAIAAAPILADNCYRFCTAVRDFYWYTPNTVQRANGVATTYLPDAQWYIKSHNALVLVAKGGGNNESHNHNDCGSFLLLKNSTSLFADFGAGLYDKDYFAPQKRYDIFVNRSYSHNIAIVNGNEQKAGEKFACKNTAATDNKFETELTNCYDCKELILYKREYSIENDIIIKDVFEFNEKADVSEIFVSRSAITLQNGSAKFEQNGEAVTLSFDENIFTQALLQEEFCDHDGNMQTAYILKLTSQKLDKLTCEFIIKEVY